MARSISITTSVESCAKVGHPPTRESQRLLVG